MPLSTGDRIGPYEIVAPIGAGGMGEVWRALDTRLNRNVALKLLHSGGDRSRFQTEARALAALNHPNIVAIFDVGDDYLVTELVEGSPLKSHGVRNTIDLAAQAAEGLAAAHSIGVCHRDLKPANILVTGDGRVKIIDFGIAKLKLSGPDEATLTVPGTVMGTAAYMSPEQVRGQEIDSRSDIFTLGAILYEQLAGTRPFQGDTAAHLMTAICDQEPSELPNTVPSALKEIVYRCLEKDPRQRFQSASDLAFALRSLHAASGVHTTIETTMRSAKKAWLWPAISAASLLAGAGVTWLAARGPAVESGTAMRLSIPWNEPGRAVLSLSPDGRRLYSSVDAAYLRPRRLRTMNGVEGQAIQGSAAWGSQVIWSPDGKMIAFYDERKLQKMPADGGPKELIAESPDVIFRGDWGNNGVMLLHIFNRGIAQVPAAGGPITPAAEGLPAAATYGAHFLPDGKRFLFFWNSEDAGKRGTYMATLGGKDMRKILPAERGYYVRQGNAEGIVYANRGIWLQRFDSGAGQLQGEPVKLDDGEYSVTDNWDPVAASATGVLMWHMAGTSENELDWLDGSGKKVGSLPAKPGALNAKISWQGKRIVYRITGNGLGVTEANRNLARVATTASQTLSHPVWSADGSKFAYTSAQAKLLLRHADVESPPVELLAMAPIWPQDWTKDGKYILYTTRKSNQVTDLMALPMDGDKPAGKPFPVMNFQRASLHTSISPDGKWLAFSTPEVDGTEVFVTPFADRSSSNGQGPKWQVSSTGGVNPHWSPDGRKIYFLSRDAKKMMAAGFQAGNPPSFTSSETLFEYNFKWNTGTRSAYEVDPVTGRFLVIGAVNQNYPPISTLVNWADLLNKK